MKAAFTPYLLIIIYLLSSVSLRASDSGWNDSSYFKYEKLIIPGLQAVQFSEDGSKFYTFNTDSTIRIWNTATGKLLDSIILDEKPTKLFFSSDGKTAGYYTMLKDIENYPSSRLYKYIIYDISLKKELAHSIYNLGSIIKPGDNFYFFAAYSLNVMNIDYFSSKNKLYISYGVNTQARQGADDISFKSGGSGIFKLLGDSIILDNQISTAEPVDMFYFGDSIYFNTDWNKYQVHSGPGDYWYHSQSQCLIFNMINNADSLKLSFWYDESGNWYKRVSNKSGHYEYLSRVFCDPKNSLLLIKSNNGIYYENLNTNKIFDTLKLADSSGIEKITNDLKFWYC
jgi:hypothetical protein